MSINILSFQKDVVAKSKSTYIKGMDWEDIAQELYLHLWQKRDRFNPKRASERTFVIRIITNKIRDLLRKANAQKRFADNNTVSLDELMDAGFDVACPNTIYV